MVKWLCDENPRSSARLDRFVVHHPRRRTQRGSFVKPLGEKRLRLLYSVAMADRCGRTTRVVAYLRSSRSCPNDIAQECNRTTFDFHGSACRALLYCTTQRTQCGETARPEANHATREFDRCVTIARAERLRTSGFSCFIERPTKNDAWPMCANREAGEALLPVEQYRVRLRASGASDSAITDSILRGYRSGRFRPPPTGALAYMLSRSAWTRDPETGVQAFLTPHVHIYAPNVTNASLGVDTARRLVVPMRVEREGRPDASIIAAVKLIDPAPPRR